MGGIEELVHSTSTELLGVRAEDLGPTIRAVLGRLAGAIGADRAYVVKLDVADRSAGAAFEEWWAPSVEQRATPIDGLPKEAQRFWYRSLRSGDVVAADDLEALEPRCPEAAAALRDDGVRSILFVPLLAQEATVGFAGFEGRQRPITWDEATTSRLRVVGELIVLAVERCHNDLERVATAAALAARNDELERSNRELQQFASVVSHDLLQPLAVVQGFVEQLTRIGVEHPTKADLATMCGDAAKRATTRMRTLIEDVLAVARAGAPVSTPEDVDLNEVVADVVADLDDEIVSTGATVHIDHLPTVEGSRIRLHQLFQNLVANALKFSRPGRAPSVTVSGAAHLGRGAITVVDDGVGIAPDDRAVVFEMFTRASGGDASGSGIGLAVCARVVAAHGGTIRIGDEPPGGGCMVVVDLPRRQR